MDVGHGIVEFLDEICIQIVVVMDHICMLA